MTNIAVLDYGIGNIRSILNALKELGCSSVSFTGSTDELLKSDIIIFPGVGAFPAAMQKLKCRGLDKAIKKACQERITIVGICLGMQLFFEKSEEFGENKGLGLLKGEVKKIKLNTTDGKLPSIGWKNVTPTDINNPFKKSLNSCFYFVHSYSVRPLDDNVITSNYSYYDETIVASVQKDNIYGFQFHPEKSGDTGLNLLKNLIFKAGSP